MRKIVALLAAGGLLLAFTGGAHAAKGPTTVFTDPVGDAGNDTAGPLPVAGPAGFDLVSGSILKVGDGLQFTVTQDQMPSTGTLGEGFRLLWHFDVGSDQYRFTVKSLDIGKPDPVAQTGTERVGKVYQGVARLETCAVDSTLPVKLSNCTTLAYYDAKFDSAAKSETWTMPLADIKAKVGSVITSGTGAASDTCVICWVPHYAERSLTPTTIIDAATMTTSYKVPKK
jgi:hypothetical protein